MDIQFGNVTTDAKQVRMIANIAIEFDELKTLDGIASHHNYELAAEFKKVLAAKIADEYLEQHKMDILNQISQDDIVKAIQLKIIEGFSLHNQS